MSEPNFEKMAEAIVTTWHPDTGNPFVKEKICFMAEKLRAAFGQEKEPVRSCTCHPEDNPPAPCARKYALSECKQEPVHVLPEHDLRLALANKWGGCNQTSRESCEADLMELERRNRDAVIEECLSKLMNVHNSYMNCSVHYSCGFNDAASRAIAAVRSLKGTKP